MKSRKEGQEMWDYARDVRRGADKRKSMDGVMPSHRSLVSCRVCIMAV